jgi:hypothetical protein
MLPRQALRDEIKQEFAASAASRHVSSGDVVIAALRPAT